MQRFICQIAFLIALVAVVASQQNCPQVCPALWAPVCGSDGKTYSNECSLRAAVCKVDGGNLKMDHVGECKKARSDSAAAPVECPTSCLKNYDPVCANDGKTYSNECDMKLARCRTGGNADLKKDHDGPCAKDQPAEKECPTICPLNFAPLCGSDGTTYSNECQLKAHNCQQKEQHVGDSPFVAVTVAKPGACNAAPASAP